MIIKLPFALLIIACFILSLSTLGFSQEYISDPELRKILKDIENPPTNNNTSSSQKGKEFILNQYEELAVSKQKINPVKSNINSIPVEEKKAKINPEQSENYYQMVIDSDNLPNYDNDVEKYHSSISDGVDITKPDDEIEQSEIIYNSNKHSNIILSSKNPKQGDPLIITVVSRDQIKECTGKIGNKELNFVPFYNSKACRAAVGFDIFDRPDDYQLNIDVKYTNGTADNLSNTVNIKWIPKYMPVKQRKVTYKLVPVKVKTKIAKHGKKKGKYKTITKTKMQKVKVVYYVTKTVMIPKGGPENTGFFAKTPSVDKNTENKELQFWSGSFIQPAKPRNDNIYIKFGERRDFYVGKMGSWVHDYHRALDIANDWGTPIFASNSGLVKCAEYSGGAGNAVVIDHGAGVFSSYFHLSKICVKNGFFVRKGQIVGYMGSTGRSTGSHLHWEIRSNGTRTNPYKWKRINN